MGNLDYTQVLNKIENTRRFGNEPGVVVTAQVIKVLREKGKQKRIIPYIHVAGTNGKGSVCAFFSSILKKEHMRVGTFVSPHLVDFEERITVDGCMIPKEDVTRLGNYLLDIDFGIGLTMFDYCLAMALLYFEEQQCDYMVIETGLGGRLDSTNAIGTPQCAVITKIGYDHMAILGSDIADIAAEKAGIIKENGTVVVEQQDKRAMQVIDRFHVQKLVYEAVQELRITYRWQVIKEENKAMKAAKEKGEVYKAEELENGDTLRQLLARSRYLLFKSPDKWTKSQKIRAELLFKQFEDIKHVYYYSLELGKIFSTNYDKDVARAKLALWYNKIEEYGYDTFTTVANSIENHYERILNFFVNRSTNAAAEAFNAKIKAFRASFRGVVDMSFFLFRLAKVYA